MTQLRAAGSPFPLAHHPAGQFVQSALDALAAHIAILNEQGEIIAVNRAWRHFADDNDYQYDSSYSIGVNYLAVCDASGGRSSQEASSVARGIREILAHRRDEYYLEYPCHSPHQKRWFVVHITRFEWDGQTRLIVAHQNVTELKAVQLQLDDNRRRLEAILNNVVNGIVTFNASGRLESFNPAALEIFGCQPHHLLNQPLNILFGSDRRELSPRRLIDDLREHPHDEWIGQRRDGALFPMQFGISELHMSGRRLYTGIVQDITERKRMEAELIEKERISIALNKERELREFRSRFIGMMSHELRTPLSSILLSSDLLMLYGDRVDDEDKVLYLENIRTQVAHLASLVKEMLSVSRSEKHELEFAPQPLDFAALVRQITGEFQMNHPTHNLTLKLTRPGERLELLLDARLMRQVLNNLLSNAIKYSPALSDVLIEVSREDTEVRLRVSDQGIGIPQADLSLLFQPFHRGSNTENLPGTGLGLSIVRQAVELHSGTIDVSSTLNVGTTFIITLPYRTA